MADNILFLTGFFISGALCGIAAACLFWIGRLGRQRQLLAEEKEKCRRALTELGEASLKLQHEAQHKQSLQQDIDALRRDREELRALEATLAERDRGYAKREEQAREMHALLKAQFAELADTTLAKNQRQFMESATRTFEVQKNQGEEKLQSLLIPMADTLKRYEDRLKQVEDARLESYGKLTQLLHQVTTGQERVGHEARKLTSVLRSSARSVGRWGEEQCRNVLELAGLTEGVDYDAQCSVQGDQGRQRPDFILSLPGGRRLIIDVKCSLDSFYAAHEADNEADRRQHLKAHAHAVRAHANGLSSKSYEKSVEGAVDFVILFVPGENFLAAAIEEDRALLHDFMKRGLILAGPINLIAVARTVAAMRDQARLARQAQDIADLGRKLYESLRLMGGNMNKVRNALESTVRHWNSFASQVDNRVMSRARRLDDYGATTGLEKLPEIQPIDHMVAGVNAPELQAITEEDTATGPALQAPQTEKQADS